MQITRKDFFKKACLSGACLCGFASVGFSADNGIKTDSNAIIRDDNKQLSYHQSDEGTRPVSTR